MKRIDDVVAKTQGGKYWFGTPSTSAFFQHFLDNNYIQIEYDKGKEKENRLLFVLHIVKFFS